MSLALLLRLHHHPLALSSTHPRLSLIRRRAQGDNGLGPEGARVLTGALRQMAGMKWLYLVREGEGAWERHGCMTKEKEGGLASFFAPPYFTHAVVRRLRTHPGPVGVWLVSFALSGSQCPAVVAACLTGPVRMLPLLSPPLRNSAPFAIALHSPAGVSARRRLAGIYAVEAVLTVGRSLLC
jgi:hypothetical protein